MADFAVQDDGPDSPTLYEAASTTSAVITRPWAGQVVQTTATAETNLGWVFVTTVVAPETGWIEERFLGDPLSQLGPRPIDDLNLFARECVRAEVRMNTGAADGSPAVLAEYLLALASVMSKYNVDNFGDAIDSDPVGPFQISTARWSAFLDAQEDEFFLTENSRRFPTSQIWGAAHLAQADMDAFSALETAATPPAEPSGPFLPSFLNIFHAWIFGVPAAHAAFAAHRDKTQNPELDKILGDHLSAGEINALKQAHRALVTDNGSPITVGDFFLRTSTRLNQEFKDATKLLMTAAPEAMAAQNAARDGTAPWMPWVEAELAAWDGLKETDAAGLAKINEYFTHVSYDNNGDPDPWCGAFAAAAIASVGGTVEKSLTPTLAKASEWRSWGDVELWRGYKQDSFPRGALVLLSPAEGTDSSGHVGFFNKFLPGSEIKLELIGGNQSDSVTKAGFALSRVVAVRWLSSLSAEEATARASTAVLTLARTLFGEARGEVATVGNNALVAVANVIMNRVASPRYSNDVAEVCLQKAQFSCWLPKDPNLPVMLSHDETSTDAVFQKCLEVANGAIGGGLADLTGGALHYYSVDRGSKPGWVTRSPAAQVNLTLGKHIFLTGIA